MKGRDVLKDVPNIVWVCLTFIVIAVVGAFTSLIILGKPTDELTRLINSFLNIAGLIVGGGGAAFAASAAVNAKRAAEQAEQANGKTPPNPGGEAQ